MRVASRVWLALGGFLLIAAGVYGFTAHEYGGAPLLFVGGMAFAYLASVGWVVEREEPEAEGGAEEEPEAQVAPTIWPFGFAITGLVIVIGLVVSRWILAVGIVAFGFAAAGWLRQVVQAHAHER
jgi:Cytochrome c oxidase subunit IV